MRTFFLALSIVLFSFYSSSQETFIVSTKLDSLIWNKVNEYRLSIGVPSCNIFENGMMREYSKRVTLSNSKLMVGVHSDSVGYLCNSECIFDCRMSGNTKDLVLDVEEVLAGNFEKLAELTVQGWINSPSHRNKISRVDYTISTVTSFVKITKTGSSYSLKLTCSYHNLSNKPGSTFSKTTDSYVSQLIKKGKK
jgi:hypothetical protein